MIYDLDDIIISIRVYYDWMEYAEIEGKKLFQQDLKPEDIPDEQFRQLPDGSGEIFVTINERELKMRIPKNEWTFKKDDK